MTGVRVQRCEITADITRSQSKRQDIPKFSRASKLCYFISFVEQRAHCSCLIICFCLRSLKLINMLFKCGGCETVAGEGKLFVRFVLASVNNTNVFRFLFFSFDIAYAKTSAEALRSTGAAVRWTYVQLVQF